MTTSGSLTPDAAGSKAQAATELVLASGSAVRRRLLASAGLVFAVDVADLDERPLPKEPPDRLARRLAREKALLVASRRAGALVVGSDQAGETERGQPLAKVWDEESAVQQLLSMQGTVHRFTSAAAIARDHEILWEGAAEAEVRFRSFDESTARAYVALREWQGSAGSYRLEGRGAQLVAALQGSEHAVLGFPLLPVLAALRRLAPSLTGQLPSVP